jgi:hypothetical protein
MPSPTRHYWYKPRWVGGRLIDLITKPHFQALPTGTILIAVSGQEAIKGVDDIDTSLQDGFMAFGLPNLDPHRVLYRAPYRQE